MNPLELTDSSFPDDSRSTKQYKDQSAAYMKTVDQLKQRIDDGQLEIVNLQNYNPRSEIEYPVWYEVKSYVDKHDYTVVNECEFYTSHYIGCYSYEGYAIIIKPRFGNIFNYLVSYATNIYIPYGESEISFNPQNNSYWLIALLWKAMLNKAITTGQIPKEYITITKNQKNYRGHLAIAKHIHTNLCDATRFYCTYKKLSMDNTINRVVRTIYDLLKNKGLSALVAEFDAYDKYLCSMGVSSGIMDIHEIDDIRYTRLNAPYKPVMELSRTILKNYKAETSTNNSANSEVSYFIDIAELWEMYLLKLLQNNLSSEYHVYSPNTWFGDNLLEGDMREIRPDIIIEKNGKVLMIIDAKYKHYTQLGKTSKEGVKREDIYQMTTYLHHYGNEGQNIVGLFTSPVSCKDNDIHSYTHNKNYRIGLLNLDISNAGDNIEQLHKNEQIYLDNITKILDCLC